MSCSGWRLLVGAGRAGLAEPRTWWAIPAFFVYGTLYGSSADSRWHECGHGTAFRSRWANDAVYYLASFMLLREPTLWRWSHVRHHSDTIIVGRDPEVLFTRPFRGAPCCPTCSTSSTDRRCCGGWPVTPPARSTTRPVTSSPPTSCAASSGRRGRSSPCSAASSRGRSPTWSIVPAAVHRAAVVLRRVDAVVLRHHPARRPARGRARPPPEHAHGLHEPGAAVPVPEHELPPRAPPLPDGAVPRPARRCTARSLPTCPAPNTSVLDAYREIVDALRHQRQDPEWEIPGRRDPRRPAPTRVDPDAGHVADHGAGRRASISVRSTGWRPAS